MNHKKYEDLISRVGQPDDFDALFDKAVGNQNRSGTVVAGNLKNAKNVGKIELHRKSEYVLYDIANEGIEKVSLARNCHFKYSESKGVKKYESKDGELKVERYDQEEDGEGKRIGHAKIDLASFIGKGI